MNTLIVGVKEFRNNMTSLTNRARKQGARVLVLSNNKPVFSVSPLTAKEVWHEELRQDIYAAREDVRTGKARSAAQLAKKYT